VTRKAIKLAGTQRAGPYSDAIMTQDILFISGQGGIISGSENTFEEQFKNAMSKVKEILAGSHLSTSSICKMTVYLADRKYFASMNELFGNYFPVDPPARTTIISGFVHEKMLVEIDVIATLSTVC
jgi:2-iminobutanoate/2-iminopropanoate deaminase